MTNYSASKHIAQEKKSSTIYTPIMTLEELDLLNDEEVIEGYFDGRANEPEPGGNRSKSYWHGWRNGMVDGGHAEKDAAQAILAHLAVNRWKSEGGA